MFRVDFYILNVVFNFVCGSNMSFIFTLLLILVLVDFSSGIAPSENESIHCHINATNKCEKRKINSPTFIHHGGDTRCAYYDSSSTRKEYFNLVTPGFGHNRNKVLLWFMGAGVCIGLIKFPIFWKNARAENKRGIGVYDDKTNPFYGWTIGKFVSRHQPNIFSVEIPSCTGDANVGKSTYGSLHHNGAANTAAVLKWVYENYPSPDRLIIGGASSGSLGAQMWTNRILRDYARLGAFPETTVLSDSYTGLIRQKQGAKTIKRWGSCEVDLAWDPQLQQKCRKGKFDFPEYVRATIRQNPTTSFAFVRSKDDHAVRAFYCVVKNGLLLALLNCPSSKKLFLGEEKILESYSALGLNNIASYTVEGKAHCLLPNPTFNTVNANKGQSLKEWIASVIQTTPRVQTQCAGRCPNDGIKAIINMVENVKTHLFKPESTNSSKQSTEKEKTSWIKRIRSAFSGKKRLL